MKQFMKSMTTTAGVTIGVFVGIFFMSLCCMGVLLVGRTVPTSTPTVLIPWTRTSKFINRTETPYVWKTPTLPLHTPTALSTYTPIPTKEYIKVDLRDFVTYPEKYEGQYVEITAKISNITDIKNLQLEVYEKGTYAWIDVYTIDAFDSVYAEDMITIKGVSGKEYCDMEFEFWDAVVCDAVVIK